MVSTLLNFKNLNCVLVEEKKKTHGKENSKAFIWRTPVSIVAECQQHGKTTNPPVISIRKSHTPVESILILHTIHHEFNQVQQTSSVDVDSTSSIARATLTSISWQTSTETNIWGRPEGRRQRLSTESLLTSKEQGPGSSETSPMEMVLKSGKRSMRQQHPRK